MSEFNTINNNDFMIEKIKERPINRRKLMKRFVVTISLAVVFGLVACLTILVLEPVISNWLYPEEEAPAVVIFPEEEEEMKPEDMLADNLPENQVKEEVVVEPIPPKLDQEQVDEILNAVELDKSHYVQLYQVMADYVEEIEKSLVVVAGVNEGQDWLENTYERMDETSGLVVARNGGRLFILTYIQPLKKADKIQVTFFNGQKVEATMMQKYTAADLAVVMVDVAAMGTSAAMDEIPVAVIGSSKPHNIVASPVVALGSPTGIIHSVEYGMVTASSIDSSAGDFDYDILNTDIYGSTSGRGFLFNMSGQVIGILSPRTINLDMRNMLTAYGISDMKKLISLLSSGKQVPYLGIKGISVTAEANETLEIPYGAYVTDVVINSPAMLAGLQEGDIIIGVDEEPVQKYEDLEKILYNADVGQVIQIQIMRQSQEMYKEMNMNVTLEGAD